MSTMMVLMKVGDYDMGMTVIFIFYSTLLKTKVFTWHFGFISAGKLPECRLLIKLYYRLVDWQTGG